MSLRMRMLIASMALAASMGGCDRGWQEFQRIELGQPMPADSLLQPEKVEDPNAVRSTDGPGQEGFVWGDYGAWPVPMSVGWHAVAARTDDDGRVTAKSYNAGLWSNYLLVTVPAMRRVVELQVPPSVLLEPTDEEEDGYRVGTENCRTLRGYIINAMHEVDLYTDFYDQPGFQCLSALAGANFVTYMMVAGAYSDLERSIEHLPLKGITRQGYDRTFFPVCGGRIRMQNLGQGRIRVEMNLLHVYSPLIIMACLCIQ